MTSDPISFLNITSYQDYKLNFFGIPKAANTAVRASLLKIYILNPSKLRHDEIYEHQKSIYITKNQAIEFSIKHSYTNFSVVRSPLRRMVSLYQHFVIRDPDRITELHPELKISNFEYFIEFLFKNTDDNTCNHHMKSLSHFLLSENNVIIPSIIFDLDYETKKLIKFLSSFGCVLQKVNSNYSYNFDNYLNKKVKSLIEKRYENDYNTFKFMEN